MALADGQTFAEYRILRLLGSGGMGEADASARWLRRRPHPRRQ